MKARLTMLDQSVEETDCLSPVDYWTIRGRWREPRTFKLIRIDWTKPTDPIALYDQVDLESA